jgi:hypothetical protein
MATYIINVKPQKAFQRLQVELSGKSYIIELSWNARMNAWQFDLFDSSGNNLIRAKYLHNEVNVLDGKYYDSRLPPGAIGTFSAIPGVKPSYSNLGITSKLYYHEF